MCFMMSYMVIYKGTYDHSYSIRNVPVDIYVEYVATVYVSYSVWGHRSTSHSLAATRLAQTTDRQADDIQKTV